MDINFATIMSWCLYLKTGIWKLEGTPLLINEEQLTIDRFTELFRNELKRENNLGYGLGNNPYQGIGNIYVSLDTDKKTFLVEDIYKYLSCYYSAIYEEIEGKVLCLNINEHGLNGNYFEYRNKETKEWASIKSIINGNAPANTNVKRMINILCIRELPFFVKYTSREIMFIDYNDEEKAKILEELQSK